MRSNTEPTISTMPAQLGSDQDFSHAPRMRAAAVLGAASFKLSLDSPRVACNAGIIQKIRAHKRNSQTD